MTIGIYSINNLVNGKRYVGKSKTIEKRIWVHFNLLKKSKRSKNVNRHLYASVNKYGIDQFTWEVLESFEELNPELLADREVYWMEFYNTTDRDFGYNLVKDSSSKVVIHPETIELLRERNQGLGNPNYGNYWSAGQKGAMSEIAIQRHASGEFYGEEWRAKISEASTELWKDEEKKAAMARNVATERSKYRIYQYDKNTLELVKVWENMLEIMDAYPDFHNIAIYSVANGHKKSYRGYVWRTEERNPKIPLTPSPDSVEYVSQQ